MDLSARQFNALYSEGTRLEYWPVKTEDGKLSGTPHIGETRSLAWETPDGPVIMLTGKAGYVALDHCFILERRNIQVVV